MAVSDLITSIRYQLHDTDANNFTGAEILDYINRGYNLIWSRLVSNKSDFVRKSAVQYTVDGTENYSLPTDFYNIDFMQIEGEEANLSPVNMDFIEVFSVKINSSRGVPSCYAIHNGEFYLRPIPNEIYALNQYYFYKPTALVSTDSTPFNGIADEALIAFTTSMCLNRDERNVGRYDNVTSSLLKMADRLFERRDKTLKRINAYRWEFEGLV